MTIVLKVKELLNKYVEDGLVGSIAETIKKNNGGSTHLKGLKGSLDAVISAAVFLQNHQNSLFVLHDREEAAYFHNDMQNLLGEKEIHFFPTSYKKAYQFEEIENANILQRAEVLNRINHKSTRGEIIISYPEALTEKVINKRALLQHTLSVKTGDIIQLEEFFDTLISFGFEPVDMVYEAGFFANQGRYRGYILICT